jgi:hypothetical protein
MPERISISFRLRDPDKLETADVELSSEDLAVLRAYLTEAFHLESAMQRQGGFAASYNFSWKLGEPLRISGTEPDADQRAVILHRLRPFLLDREPLYFNKVRGIVARSTSSPELGEWLVQTKLRFTSRLLQQQVIIKIGDLVINSEQALDKWLNAFEYHRDEDKAVELIKEHDPIPVDSSRPIFIMILREKATSVLHLGWLINQILAAVDKRAPLTGV